MSSCLLDWPMMSYFLFKQTKSWSSRDTELGVFLLIYQKKRLTDLKSMIAECRQTVCSFTNLQRVFDTTKCSDFSSVDPVFHLSKWLDYLIQQSVNLEENFFSDV